MVVIISACINVHRKLGSGFSAAVHKEALEKEFIKHNIPYRMRALIRMYYIGKSLRKEYSADFICYEVLILELEAVTHIPTIFAKHATII
jgi:GxxExxY protein